MENNSSTHIIIIFLLTLITVNLFILDIKVFSPASVIKLSDISTVASPPNSSPTYNTSTSLSTGLQPTAHNLPCPDSCLTIIKQATSSYSPIGSTPNNNLSSPNIRTTASREYYIPLGSGNTTRPDWEDATATETMIDPANYGTIKEAYFIASLRNPTQNGQMEAQLYNVTDKHLVWGSHVVMKGPASQTIQSDKITLEGGTKLYRVQLKSSLQYQAFLDNAKIRIITE